MDEPTKNILVRGGKRMDLQFCLSFLPKQGFLKMSRLFMQLDKPIWQTVNGPQLKRRKFIKLGFQY